MEAEYKMISAGQNSNSTHVN